MVVGMAPTAMAPTALFPTITAYTAVTTMKRCQLDSRPAAATLVMAYHHGHRRAPDGGCHRAMQQAGNKGDGVAFAAEDGGHEDEEYFGGPFSSVFGGPEWGHGPTAYVLQPTSGRSGGTGCDIPRSLPQ